MRIYFSDRNRALTGDTVIVEVLGELLPKDFDSYKNGSDLLKQGKPEASSSVPSPTSILQSNQVSPVILPNDDATDVDVEFDDDVISEPHKIARVVCVLERRPGQTYSGFLMPVGWRPGMKLEDFDDAADGEVFVIDLNLTTVSLAIW
jgi:hypothetical protein